MTFKTILYLAYYIPEGINFDPVKYVKETFSRAGYACGINFDPLTRLDIFSTSNHMFKIIFAPLLIFDAVIGSKVEQS